MASWVKQIEANSSEDVCKLLVATKSDLTAERRVAYEDGKALASNFGMEFYEVSSKENWNVHECFEGLARLMKDRREALPTPTSE